MRRRGLLSALTAGTVGLAGCSFRWGPADGGDTPNRETSTAPATEATTTAVPTTTTEPPGTDAELERPTPDLGDTVSHLEAGPRTLAIRPRRLAYANRLLVRFGFTPSDGERPPNLGVEILNPRNYAVELDPGALPVVGIRAATRQGSGGAPLLFVPSEWNRIAEGEPDVERGPEGYWRLSDGDVDGDPYPNRVRLAADDVVRADCAVVGPPESEVRETGIYDVHRTDVELTVWNSERPGPTDPSRFADSAVPSQAGPVPDVTWYHEAGPETAVYVEPRRERAELPARLGFTAVNHSADLVSAARWVLYKLVDGTFYEVDTSPTGDGTVELLPGGRGHYRLLAFADDPVDDVPEETVVGHLGGGTYAVVLAGPGTEGEPSGALVEFTAPAATVRPTDDVTAERDGATVTVRDPERDEADETATATLTRTDDAERRLIAEQIMRRGRNRPLRNTLPFVGPDVDEVVLETTPGGAGIGPSAASDRRRFRFRGTAYELVAERSPRN